MENEIDNNQTPETLVTPTTSPREGFTPRFNWAGLSLTFIFGLGNRAYLTLLVLLSAIPILGWAFGIFWIIFSGFNVEKWTLQNPKNVYRDQAEFRQVMDSWNRAGFICFIIEAAILGLYLLILIIAVIIGIGAGGGYGY